jgi:nicotinamide-nucleotide amidase
MLCEIITIGDEILIGQIVDTNSAWIAQQLNLKGIKVHQITSVSDQAEHIIKALRDAESRAQLILITGGLGPTKDDLTKNTLCSYFNCALRLDEEVLKDVETLFSKRGYHLTELNRKQAEVPDCCEAIRNANGTAPGMWFDCGNCVFVSMPGVPYEMKAMMSNDVIPKIQQRFKTPFIMHRTILTQGIGESILAAEIADWEEQLPPEIKLAYLPSISQVRLRLSGSHDDEQHLYRIMDEQFDKLDRLVSKYSYGYHEDTLEKVLGNLLKASGKTIATAESCTGGQIAAYITKVPGSSAYFNGSVVAYSNQVKVNQLHVDESLITNRGAVSEETVTAMALGACQALNSDYAIATSGIAGPDGGTPQKPVGLVWIAVSDGTNTFAKSFLFGENRERTITAASLTALNMMRKFILKNT